jgi:hypothetical protein
MTNEPTDSYAEVLINNTMKTNMVVTPTENTNTAQQPKQQPRHPMDPDNNTLLSDRVNKIEGYLRQNEVRLDKIENTCMSLEQLCHDNHSQLKYLTELHEKNLSQSLPKKTQVGDAYSVQDIPMGDSTMEHP